MIIVYQIYFLLCLVSPKDQCWAQCCSELLIYINRVASFVSHSNITCCMYTDDTAIYKTISNPKTALTDRKIFCHSVPGLQLNSPEVLLHDFYQKTPTNSPCIQFIQWFQSKSKQLQNVNYGRFLFGMGRVRCRVKAASGGWSYGRGYVGWHTVYTG